MAGPVTITEDRAQSVKTVVFDWLCDSAGAVSGTTTTYRYDGRLLYYVADPDAGGTQPSDNYDVTLVDDDGYDLLNGLGANMSNAANTYKDQFDGLGAVGNSTLQLVVANGGDEKGGIVKVWIR